MSSDELPGPDRMAVLYTDSVDEYTRAAIAVVAEELYNAAEYARFLDELEEQIDNYHDPPPDARADVEPTTDTDDDTVAKTSPLQISFCPQCGERSGDGDRFCRYCGTQLTEE